MEFSLEEAFLNPQIVADKISEMNPCKPPKNNRCPSNSSSDSSYEIYEEEISNDNKNKSSVECFFVEKSSAHDTRINSIEKLETALDNLDDKIELIEDEKLCLKQQICMKRKKLQEEILKVIEFEGEIEELEKLMEDHLNQFQSRIISLEEKLKINFDGKF